MSDDLDVVIFAECHEFGLREVSAISVSVLLYYFNDRWSQVRIYFDLICRWNNAGLPDESLQLQHVKVRNPL